MSFRTPEAKAKPQQACVGYVSEVMKTALSKSSGIYLVSHIQLTGIGAGLKQRVYFTFRPEWLVKGFNPDVLKKVEGGDSMLSVYRNHISSLDDVSLLEGLTGLKEEKFESLANALQALEVDKLVTDDDEMNTEAICDSVNSALTDALVPEKMSSDVLVGYVLRQQSEKTDEVDPQTGKPQYRLLQWMEVKEWFNPLNEKKVKSLIRSAERSADKEGGPTFQVRFTQEDIDNPVPF